jgi:hypothetical protein
VSGKVLTHHILDIDLAGAYTSALSTLPVIDWGVQGSPINVADILSSYQNANARYSNMAACVPIAFIHCEFSFPADVRNVFLPVPSKLGLVYPQQGVTTCTGPEVALALEMGASVRILRGELMTNFRIDGRPVLAFADFLGTLARQRAKEAPKTLRNLLLKETANSFYGKLAQAIDDRSVYNLSST